MNGSGGSQSPYHAQNQAAAGNPGGGDGYRATREWGEYDKVRRRGLPYGNQGPVTDGNALARMRRFCPDWDGDMRWPPPGFLEQEAALTGRADAIEQQQQPGAGYMGPVPHAGGYMPPMSSFEAHQQRCHQSTQQAFARHDAWRVGLDARDAADRQRRDAQQAADRQCRDAQQAADRAQQAASRDQQHARDMQRAQHEHKRRMRPMELDAQRRGWGY